MSYRDFSGFFITGARVPILKIERLLLSSYFGGGFIRSMTTSSSGCVCWVSSLTIKGDSEASFLPPMPKKSVGSKRPGGFIPLVLKPVPGDSYAWPGVNYSAVGDNIGEIACSPSY